METGTPTNDLTQLSFDDKAISFMGVSRQLLESFGFIDRWRLRSFAATIVDYHATNSEKGRARVKRQYDKQLSGLTRRASGNPDLNAAVNAIIRQEVDHFSPQKP